MIAPAAVQRCAMGWWEHPQLASLMRDDRQTPCASINCTPLKLQGIEIERIPMLGEYPDVCSESNIAWAVLPPAPGPDWFCVLIWKPSHLDQPMAWFMKLKSPQVDLFGEAA